jgi:acetate kinase
MAGLGHQVIWTRRLVDLLGASPLTFSKVVGAFFVGLTLGALIASRRSKANHGWWWRVACAECAVAILVIPTDEEGVIAADTFQLASGQ